MLCCNSVVFNVLMSCWCVCAAGHTALKRTQTDLDADMESCVIVMHVILD